MVLITSNPKILKNKELNFVDMHHHSTCSDGTQSPQTLAKIFAKKGVGLCITDHNQIRGSVYLTKQKDLFSIPSVEITTRESKDILAYFYSVNDLKTFWEKEIKKNIRNNAGFNLNKTTVRLASLPQKIEDYSGIPILAHPFALRPKRSSELLLNTGFIKRIKGIELGTLAAQDPKKISAIKRLNKPLTTGSDSHRTSQFTHLTADYSLNINDFLDSILKKKNILFHQKEKTTKQLLNAWTVLKNNVHLRAPKNYSPNL